MFRKLSIVSVPVFQVYCKISVLSIFVSVRVMSKSIVYSLVIAGNSAPICLLCISDDLLSILAISTSRNVWHFLPHMWSNSFNCWFLPLLLNKFGLYYNHHHQLPFPYFIFTLDTLFVSIFQFPVWLFSPAWVVTNLKVGCNL